MDLESIGTIFGSTLASFGVTWVTIVRPLKSRFAELKADVPSAPVQRASEDRRLATEEQCEELDKRIRVVERDVERIEDRYREHAELMSKKVNVEEFTAHTQFMTSAIHAMTEKVGEVRGKLSAIRKGGIT